MADHPPQNKMLGTAQGLSGFEVMVLRRVPPGVNSLPEASFFGPNADQAARGNHSHPIATQQTPGFLSSSDKAKLDIVEQTKLVAGGGTAGQVLTKLSSTNFHFAWANLPASTGGGGTTAGWAVYDTASNLATQNPTMNLGTSGYETDTRRWKLGDGMTAWNSLPYQDMRRTPSQINNPGTSVQFAFMPWATQTISYSTVPSGTVTIQVPTAAPPSGYEGQMFVRIANATTQTITIAAPAYNLVGDVLGNKILAAETVEFTIWHVGGAWFIGGDDEIPAGSITNTQLETMPYGTIKARVSAGTGAPENATQQQVRSLIDFVAPSTASLSEATTLNRTLHQGKLLVCSGALSLTVDSSTGFDQHASCTISAEGGTVTVVAGVTVNTATDLTIEQYKIGLLRRMTGANVYSLQVIG